jgi:hypothetical protein
VAGRRPETHAQAPSNSERFRSPIGRWRPLECSPTQLGRWSGACSSRETCHPRMRDARSGTSA